MESIDDEAWQTPNDDNSAPWAYGSVELFIIVRKMFDLILYVPSTIFQLNRDRSSWVEPVLS